MQRLARMTHLYEIAPWRLPADPATQQLGEGLMAATGQCPSSNIKPCVERAFRYLDAWYAHEAPSVIVLPYG